MVEPEKSEDAELVGQQPVVTWTTWIDPGVSSGVVTGHYSEVEPYARDAFWQIEGGVDGFLEWHEGIQAAAVGGDETAQRVLGSQWGSECFIPLATARAFRIQDLEPIRIEGALVALGNAPIWQRAGCQVLAGGDTPAQRKKASDDLLRRAGLWTTGKMVNLPDANDVVSATKHAVHYMLFDLKHVPTIRAFVG